MYRIIMLSGLLFISGLAEASGFGMHDSVEVYLIDSYVPPENPQNFVLSFYTSSAAKSKVMIDSTYEVPVSDSLTDSHQANIDISKMEFKTFNIPFRIIAQDAEGNQYTSEVYEFNIPEEIKMEGESNFLLLCLFGGTIFLIPNPVYAVIKDEGYFSLTKEIPVVSIRSGSYNYPMGYFSAEYSHIFEAPVRNFLRIGYKHIFEMSGIEYVSTGLNGFTNFNGFNGISPEISFGLFKIYNTFTLYTRYRFNFKPGESGSEFHEISLGLYSGSFSFYL
jgi:hypothetical protein